jgi:hypothetical protein
MSDETDAMREKEQDIQRKDSLTKRRLLFYQVHQKSIRKFFDVDVEDLPTSCVGVNKND